MEKDLGLGLDRVLLGNIFRNSDILVAEPEHKIHINQAGERILTTAQLGLFAIYSSTQNPKSFKSRHSNISI